jgi:hypothetical protein
MKKRETNREFGVGAHVIVNKRPLGAYNGRIGTVVEIVFDSRYGVKFDNSKEATVYLDSACLSNYSATVRARTEGTGKIDRQTD